MIIDTIKDYAPLTEALAEAKEYLPEGYLAPYVEWLNDRHDLNADTIVDMLRDFVDVSYGVWETFGHFAYNDALQRLGVQVSLPCEGRVWNAELERLGDALAFAISHFNHKSYSEELSSEFDTYPMGDGTDHVLVVSA